MNQGRKEGSKEGWMKGKLNRMTLEGKEGIRKGMEEVKGGY